MTTRIIHAPQLWMCGMKKATIGRHQGDTLINSFDCPRILIPQGFHLFQATCGKGAVGGDRATPGRQISRENAGKWLRIGVLGCLGDAALVIAMVMMVAMGVVAHADGEVTITVPETDNHTYEVYQIFTGTVDRTTLSDVRWGANGTGTVNTAVPTTTLNTIEALTGSDTELAETLKTYANLSSTPLIQTLTKDTATTDRKVAPGYYLIKDKDSVTLTEGDEHTLYIVQVLNDFSINRKAGTTTSDKKVDDVNDSDSTDSAANVAMQTSSDYDIGDWVPYHLKATLSEKVEQYQKYHITFEDVLEDSKFDGIDLKAADIKINNVTAADTDNYTVAITGVDAADEHGFTVKLEFTPKTNKDLSSLNSAVITIDFKAKLGSGAAIGSAGNKNTLTLKYSSNPNDVTGGEEKPDTPKEVITFTYKVVIDKVDDQTTPAPLAGAGFTLYKVTKTVATTGVTGTDANAKNEAWDLVERIYKKTVAATAGTDGTTLSRFSFEGIDDGYYVLCETTTPTGYNTMEPKVFKVEATHGGSDGLTLTDLNWTKVNGEITFEKNVTDGSLTATIQNNKGTTLPETGGIGTTIFYVLGTILVLGAGILLVTRRRVSAN